MIDFLPSNDLDTDGLTRSRTPRPCTTCKRVIKKSELYSRSFGGHQQCIVCVTRWQLRNLRVRADGLIKWLEKRK